MKGWGSTDGVGALLGPFELTRPIGQGAAGRVYAAVHRPSETPVAVKVLLDDRARSSAARVRFQAEVRAMAALDHPHVVRIFDAGEVPEGHDLPAGSPFLAMELAQGGSLASRRRPRDWTQLCRLLEVLLEALAHAHARGLVHRDVKPGNLLWFGGGELIVGLKLGDFGIAHALDADRSRVAGTPAYMAPELFAPAVRPTPSSDLYAVGCVAHTLVTGRPPFGIGGARELARAHRSYPPPPLVGDIAVPDGFRHWIDVLLRKRPETRLQRAADALAALRSIGGPTVAAPGGSQPPREGDGALAAPLPAPAPPDWRSTEDRGLWSRPDWKFHLSGAGLSLLKERVPPILGREEERDALWTEFRTAAWTRTPRSVRILGERGLGRSRLAIWLAEAAATRAGAWTAVVDGLAEDGGRNAVRRQVGGAERTGPGCEVEEERARVIVLDDGAGQPGAEAFASMLLEAGDERPLLVVLVGGHLGEGPADRTISLRPMPEQTLRTLAGECLGISPALAVRWARQAEGHPRMLIDLVRAHAEGALLEDGPLGFGLRESAEAGSFVDIDGLLEAAESRCRSYEPVVAFGLLERCDALMLASGLAPEDPRRGRMLALKGEAALGMEQLDLALELAEDLDLLATERVADGGGEAWLRLRADAAWVRGRTQRLAGHLLDASATLGRAAALYGEVGASARRAASLNRMGSLARNRGRHDQAQELYAAAQAAAERSGDEVELAWAWWAMSALALDEGDLERAEALAMRAETVFVERDHPSGRAVLRNARGEIARARGDVLGAEALYRSAVAEHERIGWSEIGIPLLNLGMLLLDVDRVDEARVPLRGAIRGLERSGRHSVPLCGAHIAALRVAAHDRDWEGWQHHLSRARDLLRRTGGVETEIFDGAIRAVDAARIADAPARAAEARALVSSIATRRPTPRPSS